MTLPSSGTLSVGMLNYEITHEPAGTVTTSNVASSNDDGINPDISALSQHYSANADQEGSTSRANLLASPYGMNEFYSYAMSKCILVGTEILMADGSIKLVENLLIYDEVCSAVMPDMTEENYREYSIENLDGFTKDVGLVKQLTFDFKTRHWLVNEKYKSTGKHAVFVWKDKLQTFEWWQVKDLEIGDKNAW